MSSVWEDQLNAQFYEEYAQQFPMYRQLGEKLVELAGPFQPGMTVLDLACGTGVVTAQFVEKMGTAGTVIGVDLSASMLAIARRKLPEVTFYQAQTEHLAELLPAVSVDLAVCSSAFWQMQARPVLEGLNQVLKPGGRFLFNLPMSGQSAPQLAVLMRQIAHEEYGYVPAPRPVQEANAEKKPQKAPRYGTREEVVAFLEDMPLTLRSSQTTIEIEHSAQSSYAFNRMPVMTSFPLAGLDYSLRLEILEKAYQRMDKTSTSTNCWCYYVMERAA